MIDDRMKEIMEKLQAPFPPHEIEWRVGVTNQDKTRGMALAFVTNRAIQNRLDEVFGCFGWKNEFREWRGNSQLCGISVKWGDEWITKWDGADNTDFEATKGGLSDAMKRAAYQWGIGRYLYKLDPIWVPIQPAGKSFRLMTTPQLPDWALPEEYRGKQQVPHPNSVPADPSDDRTQLIQIVRNLSQQAGWTPEMVMNGCRKYYGKAELSELSEDELHNLIDRITRAGVKQ